MDQTHTRHRCAEALTRLAVCRFVIQATTGKENLDKTDFLHFCTVRSMPLEGDVNAPLMVAYAQ
jgi:hypothetical protein